MRVGVDARLLSRQITGIGRYTLEMCRALAKIDNVSLYLYSPTVICTSNLTGLESTNIKTLNWENGLLRQIWAETYLPLWVKKDKVDVFWGPAHRLPRFLPKEVASVVTIHDLVVKYAGETMRPISRLLEWLHIPRVIHTADQIIADSQATADSIKKEFHISSNKLSVVPLAASLNKNISDTDTKEKLCIGKPYFLFVGTLEPRKNLLRLLIAFSKTINSVDEQVLLIIIGGAGWGGVNVKDIVVKYDLVEHVRILGYVNESTLATLYENAMFLAMPSLYEGFGLPLIEAMSFGTPVLTSNNSSMPEVAGLAGLFVEASDVESIRNGLTEMISNHDLRKNLARKAKENASNYDWSVSANKLVNVFEEAVNHRKSFV